MFYSIFLFDSYRVKEFWSDQGPNEILAKLRRKELTLFRAAELLNVTVTTLANYLSTLRHPSPELLDPEDYETPPSLFTSKNSEEFIKPESIGVDEKDMEGDNKEVLAEQNWIMRQRVLWK